MKKILLLFLSTTILIYSYAQDSTITAKNYLPQKGDWEFNVSLNPFIYFIGNFIRIGSDNNFYSVPYLSFSNTFKHFKTDNLAKVYYFNINADRERKVFSTVRNYETIEDQEIKTYLNLKFGLGKEKRKTVGKFQTYLGHITYLNLTYNNRDFIYGDNPDTSNFRYPSSILFKPEQEQDYYSWTILKTRPLNSSFGNIVGIAEKIYFGFEYFFLPKISVGGHLIADFQVDYYLPYKIKYQEYDLENKTITEYTENKPGQFLFNASINLVSNLSINFYF